MSDNSLACFDKMEDLIIERMLNNAWNLEQMDYAGRLSAEMLKEVAERNDIYQIIGFDRDGSRIMSS